MGRILRSLQGGILFLALLVSVPIISSSQGTAFFYEGFENNGNNIPPGWVNAMVIGNETWRIDKGAGPFPMGQIGLPDTAAFGQRNAYFRVPSFNRFVSRLITPAINLEFAVNPELTFWHAQVPRDGSNARLGVYIATSITGPWTLIASYQSPVNRWTQRVLQLPGGTKRLFLAFEGHSGEGLGGSVCVDEVRIVETGLLPRELASVASIQPTTFLVHTNSQNNLMLRTEFRVTGNTGTLNLESFRVASLNSDDADVPPEGVKLWFTTTENFINPHLLGSGKSLSGGRAIFSNLAHSLPTGYSYLWVTFDVARIATPGNHIDASLPAGSISVNGILHPETDLSPAGTRTIFETIFFDDFEQNHGWVLAGEWQREVPRGLGGITAGQSNTSGSSDPSNAVSGSRVLGTDLSGLGTFPGNYEPNLPPLAYVAISPEINAKYYNSIRLSFQRWLNVHLFDKASIDISTDNGITWTTFWTNQQVQNTSAWSQVSYLLPQADRMSSVRFRFTIGETGGTNLQSGWNIDNLVVTGNFVATDVGISQLVTPRNTCSLTNQEVVSVVVTNFGASQSPAVIPLAYSINNGLSWQRDTLRESIPVGESRTFAFGPRANFSAPGIYNAVLIRTELPADQDASNDQLKTSVFSVPVVNAPYSENFQSGHASWASYGQNSSFMLAAPNGATINQAASGSFAWVTNPFGYYNTGELSWVESPCFDLSGMANPVLDFFLNLHTPNGLAGAAAEYSTDGGLSWTRIEPRNPNLAWFWYNNNNITGLAAKTGNGRGWSGVSNGWINPRIVLPEAVANKPAVRFRLIFAAQDVPLNFEGIGLDMVRVYPVSHDVGVTAFVEPLSSCGLSKEQRITVKVSNLGINTVMTGTSIPVGLRYHNANTNLMENLVLGQNLLPGTGVNHTFSQTFDLSAPGSYNFTAFTNLVGDNDFFSPGLFNDTLTVTVNVLGIPVVNLGPDIYTTQPQSVVLDAGDGHSSYRWQDGSTGRTFNVTSPNTQNYWITVEDHNNCTATDTIRVVTYDLGLSAIIAPVSGCHAATGEQVKVKVDNNGSNIFPANFEIPLRLYFQSQLSEEYYFKLSQQLLPGQSAVATFSGKVNLSTHGNYKIDVVQKVRDANPANDSIQAIISSLGHPIVSLGDSIYTTKPDTLLLDPGPGLTNYLWQNGATNQTFQVTSPNTRTYWVTVTDSQGCSATASVVVATFDAGITQIVSPVSACSLSENEPVTIALKNFGVDTFASGKTFSLNLYHDGLLQTHEVLTLSNALNPGQTIQHTFSQTLDLKQPGTYNLIAEITTPDANPGNDQIQAEVSVHGFAVLQIPALVVTNKPDTVRLDAGPGYASYLWNTGHTGQTLTVSTWGTYNISVTNAFGCVTSGSILVAPEFMDLGMHALVSPANGCEGSFENIPVVVSIKNAGNITLPQGEKLAMRYAANGVWQSADTVITSQAMLPGQSQQFIVKPTISINQPGQVKFDLLVNHKADQNPLNDALQVNVNVNPLPKPQLGDTIFRANPVGTILKLSESYNAYLWNDGSTVADFAITSPLSQWYHVTVTDGNGCTGADSVKVIAWDLEVFDLISPLSNCTLSTSEQVIMVLRNNGPDTFLPGRKFTVGYMVNQGSSTFQTFTLSSVLGPGQFRTFAFSQGANMHGTGPFTLEVVLTEPDVNRQNNSLSRVYAAPGLPRVKLGDDIYTLRPDTVRLNAGAGFVAYHWQDGHTGQFYNVRSNGWHFVRVTDQHGCQGGDTLYVGQSTGLPPGGIPGIELIIFPNPARDEVTVRIEQTLMQALRLELLSLTGNLVMSRDLMPDGTLEEKLNVNTLKPGVYYVRLIGGQGILTRKLIVTGRH